MAAARQCMGTMVENGRFILSELPNVKMSEDLQARTRKLCDDIAATFHDVVHELAELAAAGVLLEEIRFRVVRIMQWMGEDVIQMNALVLALDKAAEADSSNGLAYMLVAESAMNIFRAFEVLDIAAKTVVKPPRRSNRTAKARRRGRKLRR